MKFADRKFITKDGRECLLTPTSPKYAEEMIEYMKITAAETSFLLRCPEEIIMCKILK